MMDESILLQEIAAKGQEVRGLKENNADKNAIQDAVRELLTLKHKYRSLYGKDAPACALLDNNNRNNNNNNNRNNNKNNNNS